MRFSSLQWINSAFERWFTASEPNAAGRMGVFRILYSVFYLWNLSYLHAYVLAHVPENAWEPIFLFEMIGRPPCSKLRVERSHGC